MLNDPSRVELLMPERVRALQKDQWLWVRKASLQTLDHIQNHKAELAAEAREKAANEAATVQ